MNRPKLVVLLCCACAIAGAAEPAPQRATATFIDADGRKLGTATLLQTPAGVLIEMSLTGLPAGVHAFHVHEKGVCDAAGRFESAGKHYAPRDQQHGLLVPGGPHSGDMPNQFVAADGALRAEVLNPHVTLGAGPATLFDADGSALVIHAKADDHRSQPSGNAGDRIACAVVKRATQ